MTMGVCDKVIVLGMGCSRFGERWESDPEDLIVEAFTEALADAGVDSSAFDAAWSAVAIEEQHTGKTGIPLSNCLRLSNIPVSFSAGSGFDALRAASYAVAAGACEMALVVGYEKLKDTGFGGIPQRVRVGLNSLYWPAVSPPGAFAQLANAYRATHKIENELLERATAAIAVNSHSNGYRNAKAHLRLQITEDQVRSSSIVADPIRLLHCCGVSDGATCAILGSPHVAARLGRNTVVSIKALQLATTNGFEAQTGGWDGSHLTTTRVAAARAYREAGLSNPREQIHLLQLHDCFSIAELVALEDIAVSAEGRASYDVLDGFFLQSGRMPAQTDGGLKCFGHPIGASGVRMLYEVYLQLLGRGAERQVSRVPSIGLINSLSGFPHQNTSYVGLFGLRDL